MTNTQSQTNPQTPTLAPESPKTSTASKPDNSPIPMPSPIINSPVKKSKNKLLPVVIILAILTLAGVGVSIYFGIRNSNQASEISDLKTQIDNLTKENDTLRSETNKPGQTTVNKPQNPGEQTPNTPIKETLYLEPEGWNVKFAYPEGVTKIVADTNDNFNGTLYIYSITYNDKTYDVNLFGGAEAYRHYPFFLGTIMRWDKNAMHESWNNAPSAYNGNTLILEQDSLEYYYGGGNGYEAGDKADYDKAVELVSQLLHNITTKN